ncbi:MAG: caspase family protein [Bacteroidota bacterium]
MKKYFLSAYILLFCAVSVAHVEAQVRSRNFSFGGAGLPDLNAIIDFRDDNGNKILENRERGEIILKLFNSGKGNAEGIDISVENLEPDPNLLISRSQTRDILLPNDTVTLRFNLTATKNIETKSHKLRINVTEKNGQDMDPAYLILPTLAYDPPQLQVAGVEIVKVGENVDIKKADDQLHPKERVYVRTVIQNVGQSPAPNVRYTVANTHQYIKIENVTGNLGTLQPGEVKEFLFKLTTPAQSRMEDITDNLPLFLTTENDEEQGNLVKWQLPIKLEQRPPVQNIVEVKPKIEALKKTFAKFELSNKFKANEENTVDIRNITPSMTKRPKSVGVVIGVEQYKDIAPAPFASNDAVVMEQYFKNILGIEQVIVLKNEEVTFSSLDDIFNPLSGSLASTVKKGETDVFIFYSGHGIPDKSGETTYLFPSDGKIANLENRAYALPKFYSDLNSLGARSITVILDACFSGAARKTQYAQLVNLTGQKGIKLRINKPWESYKNFTVINSSTSDETSLGYEPTETGLFTYYIAAGLKGEADANGDKKITLGELRAYVIKNVSEMSRKLSGAQTPEFYGDDDQVLVEFK